MLVYVLWFILGIIIVNLCLFVYFFMFVYFIYVVLLFDNLCNNIKVFNGLIVVLLLKKFWFFGKMIVKFWCILIVGEW